MMRILPIAQRLLDISRIIKISAIHFCNSFFRCLPEKEYNSNLRNANYVNLRLQLFFSD